MLLLLVKLKPPEKISLANNFPQLQVPCQKLNNPMLCDDIFGGGNFLIFRVVTQTPRRDVAAAWLRAARSSSMSQWLSARCRRARKDNEMHGRVPKWRELEEKIKWWRGEHFWRIISWKWMAPVFGKLISSTVWIFSILFSGKKMTKNVSLFFYRVAPNNEYQLSFTLARIISLYQKREKYLNPCKVQQCQRSKL